MPTGSHSSGDHEWDSENRTLSTQTRSISTPPQRDEVQEVRKQSQKETRIIHLWRIVVTLVHLSVATVVTIITYQYLKDAEHDQFQTAFRQFSRSVADTAVQHQWNIRDAHTGLVESIESSAMAENATWPFFTMPYFEARASQARKQSRSEALMILQVVQTEERDQWLEYTDVHHEQWVKEGHMLESGNLDRLKDETNYFRYMHGGPGPNQTRDDYYMPAWSFSPPPISYGFVNWDARTIPEYERNLRAMFKLHEEKLTFRVRPYRVSVGTAFTEEEHQEMHSELRDSETSHPHAWVASVVHERLRDNDSKIVAVLIGAMALDAALQNLLPDGIQLTTVITNTCEQAFTYDIVGHEAIYRGEGDRHDPKYSEDVLFVDLFEGMYTTPEFETTPDNCLYYMHIYPNEHLESLYKDNIPEVYAAIVATTFFLVAVVFFLYDVFVQRRNEKMVASAARSNAVVTSLFPDRYRDSMMEQAIHGGSNTGSGPNGTKSKPLADLFLESTVLFADIAGFTAWSSVREPHQVFTLLETVYGAFDKVAKRRGVFKVETVGDCYVAAVGLPTPRSDHATVMCRFARDIMDGMSGLMSDLVVKLGPDTGDLMIRVGVHSGPVTAGVLRGERARFQLFGDTVNTASRIESTSTAGKVQISQATMEQLVKAGKGHWATKRSDKIVAKGKGELETYWLLTQGSHKKKATSGASDDSENVESDPGQNGEGEKQGTISTESDDSALVSTAGDDFDERTARLIDWNTEVLGRLLCAVVARRSGLSSKVTAKKQKAPIQDPAAVPRSFLEEVEEIIHLPEFDQKTARLQLDPELVELPESAAEQLHHFVASIAALYRDNPFHSFEHASHVVMSVNKLMSRIVAPSDVGLDDPNLLGSNHGDSVDSHGAKGVERVAATLHDHTYGITSDPLTQFSCALSALIHDVDHQGVTNAQLVEEENEVACLYDNRSPAEQNSLELAWELLMEESYSDLRATIYSTDVERSRFRQLLVNSVMATDIADKELKVLRNNRWDKAFFKGEEESFSECRRDAVNRKATIVIEHLIQASDVSHTMQHWHIYRRWNENLFRECYKAFREGRADADPTENWYKGEIGFFDFYIIPLAKKLKECGVFGKSSGEFLNYASENRKEWTQRGEEITQEMKNKVEKEFERTSNTHHEVELAYYSDEEMDIRNLGYRMDSDEFVS